MKIGAHNIFVGKMGSFTLILSEALNSLLDKKNNRWREDRLKQKYSFLWRRYHKIRPPEKYHFSYMQEVIPDKIVRGLMGLEVGCGCGWDLLVMAENNPSVRIIGIDISEGVYLAARLNKALKNAEILRASGEYCPFKDNSFDFVYSFGVLHHMPDYHQGFLEIRRILKKDSPCFLYLYENHSENKLKCVGIKLVSLIRKITIRMPAELLFLLSCLVSPLVTIVFTYPALFFKKFKHTYWIYKKMPFNFGTGIFSLSGDLYDRFGTPIEHRFSREQLINIFNRHGFYKVNITKLKDTAGWVVWGYKK